MKPRIVNAARGARWLADGWRLFRAAPLGWLAAVFGYWLLMTVVSLVPFIGIGAASVLVPAFSVGFMAIARAAERSGSVELALLFDGFRHAPRSQLALGLAYFACLATVLGASTLADDGALARWMLSGQRPDEDVLHSDAFFGALVWAMTLYAPVMLAFWFAPPLVAWHSAGMAKSLFFSFFACLMNWKAFLAYGAVTLMVTLVIPFVALTAVAFATGGAIKLSAPLVFPLLIILLPTLFASFYASYRDIFGSPERQP